MLAVIPHGTDNQLLSPNYRYRYPYDTTLSVESSLWVFNVSFSIMIPYRICIVYTSLKQPIDIRIFRIHPSGFVYSIWSALYHLHLDILHHVYFIVLEVLSANAQKGHTTMHHMHQAHGAFIKASTV